MLRRIRSLLTRIVYYEPRAFSTLTSCMNFISTRLDKHLSGEHYRWKENEWTKTLECLILSKFLTDYALLTTFTGRVPGPRMQFYREMTDAVFESILNTTFPLLQLSEFAGNKLKTYSDIMSGASHPMCWQRLAGACTGIDYYSERDQPTLTASSLVLPALLQSAQGSWTMII